MYVHKWVTFSSQREIPNSPCNGHEGQVNIESCLCTCLHKCYPIFLWMNIKECVQFIVKSNKSIKWGGHENKQFLPHIPPDEQLRFYTILGFKKQHFNSYIVNSNKSISEDVMNIYNFLIISFASCIIP